MKSVIILSLALTWINILQSSIYPILPTLGESMGDMTANIMNGMYPFAQISIFLLECFKPSKLNQKHILQVSIFLLIICNVLFGLLDVWIPEHTAIFTVLCFVLRFLTGIFSAVTVVSCFNIGSTYDNISLTMGLLHTGFTLGLSIGSPISGYLFDIIDYYLVFLVFSLFGVLLIPSIYFMVHYNKYETKITNIDDFKKVLFDGSVLCLSLASAIYVITALPFYLTDYFFQDTTSIGLVLLAICISYSFASPIIGYFTDLIEIKSCFYVIIGGFVITFISFLLLMIRNIYTLVITLIVLGIANNMMVIPMYRYTGVRNPGLSMMMISNLLNLFLTFGEVLGTVSSGILIDTISYNASFILWGTIVLGCGLTLFFRRRNDIVFQVTPSIENFI